MKSTTPMLRRSTAALLLVASLASPLMADAEKSDQKSNEAATVLNVQQADKRPVPVFQARPQYPFSMRKANRGGEVIVEYVVSKNGDVIDARAIRSSDPEFEPSAVQAVSKWRFKPAVKDGKAVAVKMQTPIVFSLN